MEVLSDQMSCQRYSGQDQRLWQSTISMVWADAMSRVEDMEEVYATLQQVIDNDDAGEMYRYMGLR